jgi:hypothetical protein
MRGLPAFIYMLTWPCSCPTWCSLSRRVRQAGPSFRVGSAQTTSPGNDLPGSAPLSIRRQGNVAVAEGPEPVGQGAAILPVNCR